LKDKFCFWLKTVFAIQ